MTDIQPLVTPLWIMAGVGIFEMLLLVAIGIGGYRMYTRLMTLANDLETRHVAPVREKVDLILGDVRSVTSRVAYQTEQVDDAITSTIDRVDETAARVRAGVHDRVSQAASVVRGVRAVIVALLHRQSHA